MHPYLILGIFVVIGLLGVGVMRVVNTYTEAITAVAQKDEEIRLKDVALRGRDVALKRKQEMLDESEAIAQRRGRATALAQGELDERDRLIAELRRKNSTVDAFLSQPVPPELRGAAAATRGSDSGVRDSDRGSGTPADPAADRRDGGGRVPGKGSPS